MLNESTAPYRHVPTADVAIGAPAFLSFHRTEVAIGYTAGMVSNVGLSADSKFTANQEESIDLMGDGTVRDGSGNILDWHS